MPLPRLIDVGDTFTGTPRAIDFTGDEGQYVRFLFAGFADHEELLAPRITMDARFMTMGFYDPPAPNAKASEIDGVVRYDEAIGEPLVFSVIAAKRAGRKGWDVQRAPKALESPKAPTPVAAAPAPVAPAPVKAEPAAPPPARVPRTEVVRAPEKSPEAKRADIRAAYARELALVIAGPAKVARKAKVPFDVNGATAFLCIEMAKRGCL